MFHATGAVRRASLTHLPASCVVSVAPVFEGPMTTTVDGARERALELALQHHAQMADNAETVVTTAQVFLEFLIAETPQDKEFKAGLEHLAREAALVEARRVIETTRPID